MLHSARQTMGFAHLPFDANLEEYQQQAEALLRLHKSGDAMAMKIFHENHPQFLDTKIVWLPRKLGEAEIENAPLDIEDAQLAVARCYDFLDWTSLTAYAEAVNITGSAV